MQVKTFKDIADILDKQRVDKAISKNQLMKFTGLSRPTLLKILSKGRVRDGYNLQTLFDVAKALEVEILLSPIASKDEKY